MTTITNNSVFSLSLQAYKAWSLFKANSEAGIATAQVGPAILELETGAIMRFINAVGEAIPFLLFACLMFVGSALTIHEYQTLSLFVFAASIASALASAFAFGWSLTHSR